jgi:hypothetical protein
VGKVGREKFCKQTASLKGRTKIREIMWSNARGEVMVGAEDGTVTIWSAKKASSICLNYLFYIIRCH